MRCTAASPRAPAPASWPSSRTVELPVLVATDVAARGIHVDDIGLVLQVDPPGGPKEYLHRAGRTARAGDIGSVVTLVLPHQRREVSRLMSQAGVRGTELSAAPGDAQLSRGDRRPDPTASRSPISESDVPAPDRTARPRVAGPAPSARAARSGSPPQTGPATATDRTAVRDGPPVDDASNTTMAAGEHVRFLIWSSRWRRVDDAAAMVEVIHAAFGARPPLDPPSTAINETPSRWPRACAQGGGIYASVGGRPAGAIVILPEPNGVATLHRVSVHPDFQRHGIASAMVAAAEELAAVDGSVDPSSCSPAASSPS